MCLVCLLIWWSILKNKWWHIVNYLQRKILQWSVSKSHMQLGILWGGGEGWGGVGVGGGGWGGGGGGGGGWGVGGVGGGGGGGGGGVRYELQYICRKGQS